MTRKTDLAMEAREIWRETAGETAELPGVRAKETTGRGITTTVVEILDQRGVRALRKPVGTYVTLEFQRGTLRDRAGFGRAAARLGKTLSAMIPQTGPILVAGLGNEAVTPDAIGPKTLDHLLVTRHLGGVLPRLRQVSAIAPGVLGVTGLESVEVVRGVVERAEPCCIVVVDALASREPHRLCKTVQLADTGIVPGSGVRNSRAAFDRDTLGVPVVAVGVPTVVDAATFLEDTTEKSEKNPEKQKVLEQDNLVLTPRDIDAQIARITRLLGYGISLGLHSGLNLGDITCLLG